MTDRHVTFTEQPEVVKWYGVALNDAVRSALGGGGRRSVRRYRVPTRRMGVRKGIDLDHAGRLLGEFEDEEVARKLALRK